MSDLIEKMKIRVEASLADARSPAELKLLAETLYELSNAESTFLSLARETQQWDTLYKLDERVSKLEERLDGTQDTTPVPEVK